MELKLYFRMLLRGWWIIALTTLAALNVTLIVSYRATPQYGASARFLLGPSKLLDTASFIRILDIQTFLPTIAEIWNSETVFQKTGAALQMTLDELYTYNRTAVLLPSSNVIELTVSGPNPTHAALIANTMGGFAASDINDQFPVITISQLDPATVAQKPFSPQPARDAGLAAALGLVVGCVLAIVSEQLRVPLESLRRRTTIDGESSAFNRSHFQRSLETELNRNRSGQVSLGLVQLSGLTDLYDNMPPLARQRLMQYVTHTLQKELRGGDSVGRWNDTIFGVLLPSTPSVAATRTLERIQRALTIPVEIDKGDRLELHPYVGVAVITGDQPPQTLMTQAESALEQARLSNQDLVLHTDNGHGAGA